MTGFPGSRIDFEDMYAHWSSNKPALLRNTTIAIAFLVLAPLLTIFASQESSKPYGLTKRPQAKAFLRMPQNEKGPFPALLSQTGAFRDVHALTPDDSLIPYGLNVSFWSDGASKWRWVALPDEGVSPGAKIKFAPAGEWTFPAGTVFVKHFEMATDEAHPELKRRLETRLLVRDTAGSVYGVSYKWRADNSDADLLSSNLTETILVKTATGMRTQTWYYPSRQDCRTCHTDLAGGVLGVKTRQLNGDFTFSGGVTDNQLRAWNHAGLFEPVIEESNLAGYAKLARADDKSRSLEERARSYLDANCSQCHRPQGTVANFDARYDVPLSRQNLIAGQVLINEGIDDARIIAPNDIWRSILFMRASATDAIKMPPLAHERLDEQGTALLREWIESLPGPPVLPPPTVSPVGGDFSKPISVTLRESEPGAIIRYTLDGSKPSNSDAIYDQPIRLAGPTTLRARAFKNGYTKSITAQETFIITN